MQQRGHKTKLLIPAGAGTNQPADVGDQPGRLGEGRNRIPRAAISRASIDNIIQAQKNDACFALSFRGYQRCFNG
jgi:hypothetical protein